MQKRYQLDKESLIKTGKGALIAGGGVALMYILQWLSSADYGQWTPLITGLLAVIINSFREWRKGESMNN